MRHMPATEGLAGPRQAKWVCFAVFVVGAGVNLPVPLYGAYAQLSGASERSFGLVFSAYALGVLPSLLFLGGLSDRVGRRPPLLVSVLLSVGTVSILATFPGITSLAVARVLQGLAVGLVGASATPFLAELLVGERLVERAAAQVTAMLATGFAFGGLSTGLALWAGPTLMPLSYPTLIALGVVSAALLATVPEVGLRRATPMLRLPYFPSDGKGVCLSIGAIWCLVGTVLSIVPLELGLHGLAKWSGLSTFLMPFAGLVCRRPCRYLSPSAAIRVGAIAAPFASLALAFGVASSNLLLIMAGAAGTGIAGLGVGFYGGLAVIAELSGEERARGSAAFFLSCYLGLCAAPPILGVLSTYMPMASALRILTVMITGILAAAAYVGRRKPSAALIEAN